VGKQRITYPKNGSLSFWARQQRSSPRRRRPYAQEGSAFPLKGSGASASVQTEERPPSTGWGQRRQWRLRGSGWGQRRCARGSEEGLPVGPDRMQAAGMPLRRGGSENVGHASKYGKLSSCVAPHERQCGRTAFNQRRRRQR